MKAKIIAVGAKIAEQKKKGASHMSKIGNYVVGLQEQEVDELEEMLDDVFYKTFGRHPLKGEELKQLQRRTYMPELDANGKFVRDEWPSGICL